MAHTATRRHKRVRVEMLDGTVLHARFHDRNDRHVFLKDEEGKDIKLVRGNIRSLSDYKPRPHELEATDTTFNTGIDAGMSTNVMSYRNKGNLLGNLLGAAGVKNAGGPMDNMLKRDVFDSAPSIAIGVVSCLGALGRASVERMATLLEGRATATDIEKALRLALLCGLATQQRDEYVMSPKQRERHLKEIRRGTSSVAAKFELKEPNLSQPPAEGIINLAEGFDLTIWKIMQDRQWHTREEIFKIAVAFGPVDRHAFQNRISVLVAHKWFDIDKRARNLYRLRKATAMPKAEAAASEPVANYTEVPDQVWNQTQIFPVPVDAASIARQDEAERAEEANEVAEIEPDEQDAAPESLPMFDGTETLRQAIWKVMADQQPWDTSEIILLLSETHINTNSISAKMTELWRAGWFDRKPFSRTFQYTLRDGIEYPGEVLSREMRDTSNDPEHLTHVANDNAETNTNTQTTEEEIMTSNKRTAQNAAITDRTAAAAAATAVTATPLIEVSIRLKGQSFTLAEATELVKELYANGYGAGPDAQRPTSKLFETKIVIRGQEYAREELSTIVKTLRNEGVAVK